MTAANPEFLKSYIRNHSVGVLYYMAVAVAFLFGRVHLYGMPDVEPLAAGMIALMAAWVLILRKREIFNEILKSKTPGRRILHMKIAEIACLKVMYMGIWLLVLFWPMHSPFMYEHLLGYFFIFCAIALYTSASAVFLPLFILDIGFQLAFAIGITVLNSDIQETKFVGILILVFGAFAVSAGLKIRKFAVELVGKRQALEAAVKRADQANRAKSEFLAVVSHEIRTPMTGIVGMIDVLRETGLTEEQRDGVDTIKSCSATLLNTLNDILDVSKMEAGKFAIDSVDFDLHSLMQGTAWIVRQTARDKGIALDMSIAADVPRHIYGDPNRIRQIVLNLLNNAVKFTAKGEVFLSVSFRSGLAPVLRIEVRDTGIGIDKKDQAKLFKAFSQADGSVARRYGGTGLGLSIARRLVELMEGKIGVVSEPGKGSVFWFEMPYHEADAEKLAGSVGGEEEASSRPMDILLVEDNAVNQRIAIRFLEKQGHRVVLAAGAARAFSEIENRRFDLILMDLNLPGGMDGIEAARRIRERGGWCADVPVIALTANVTDEHIAACYRAGMNGHIAKPFEPKDLRAVTSRFAPAVETEKSGRIAALEDEFGPEYARTFVTGTLGDIEEFMRQAYKSYGSGDMERLRDLVHDLVSMCGAIGLDDLSGLARSIETAAQVGDHEMLRMLMPTLAERAGKDIPRLRAATAG